MFRSCALFCLLSCWLAIAAFPQVAPLPDNNGNRSNPQQTRGRQTSQQRKVSGVPAATFTGTVQTASNKALAIKRDDGNILDFWCTHKTRYVKGSKRIKPSNLSQGEAVSVQALPAMDGSLQAIAVTVQQPKPPPPRQ